MPYCKCEEKIIKAVQEGIPNSKDVSLQKNLFNGKTYSDVYYIDEKGKHKTYKAIHDYCPWCGGKYPSKYGLVKP